MELRKCECGHLPYVLSDWEYTDESYCEIFVICGKCGKKTASFDLCEKQAIQAWNEWTVE